MDQMAKRNKNQIEYFASNKPTTTKSSALLGLVIIAVGMFPLLLGLGVIHVATSSAHAPLFVVAAVGAAFVAAGLAVSLQGLGVSPKSFVMKILGLGIVCSMLTPFGWVVFGDSGADMFIRVVFGLFIAFFILIFLIATVASLAPDFAARFGIRVIENNEADKPRISKQRKL